MISGTPSRGDLGEGKHVSMKQTDRDGGEDALLTVADVANLLRVSKGWVYGPSGRALIGEGFVIGRVRRFRKCAVMAALARREEAAQ